MSQFRDARHCATRAHGDKRCRIGPRSGKVAAPRTDEFSVMNGGTNPLLGHPQSEQLQRGEVIHESRM